MDEGAEHALIIRPCHSEAVASTPAAAIVGSRPSPRAMRPTFRRRTTSAAASGARSRSGRLGVEDDGRRPVDQDRLALESGTVLPEGDPAGFVPPGEASRQDYRLSLPTAGDPVDGGTAAPALAAAVERLGGGRLSVVACGRAVERPVGDRTRWKPSGGRAGDAHVANVRTGALWGTRPDPMALLGYLAGEESPGPAGRLGRRPLREPRGRSWRSEYGALVLVRDSYRGLGWAATISSPSRRSRPRSPGRRPRGRRPLCRGASGGEALRERLRGRLRAPPLGQRHADRLTATES